MKEVHCRLLDLPILHPRLLWETIILAGASVLEGVEFETLTVRLGFA